MAAYPVKLGPVSSKQGIEGHLMIFAVLIDLENASKQLCTRM